MYKLPAKRLIKFLCFHCQEEVVLEVIGRSQVDRAYCKECEKDHYSKVRNRECAKKYAPYLREIQGRVPNLREKELGKIFQRKNGRIYENDVDLGLVVAENEDWMAVEKSPGIRRTISKKQCCGS